MLTDGRSTYYSLISEQQVASWLGSVPTGDIETAIQIILSVAGLAAAPTEIEDSVFLAPPSWQTPLSPQEIRSSLGTSDAPTDTQATTPEWEAVRAGRASDEEYRSVFPPRTKADLAVRRDRMATVVHAWRADPAGWVKIAEEARRYKWDYVFTMNIATQAFLCRADRWWDTAHEIGLLPATLDEFIERAKKLTALLKTRESRLPMTQWAECAGLTGFRQPPIADFNLLHEAEELAASGGRGIGTPSVSFASCIPDALRMQVPAVEWMSFSDYIRSGLWVTGGASSVGRVEVEYFDGGEERRFHFKASKAQLREVMTDDEIIGYVEQHTDQVNVAIVKAELSKLRIAVSGDLATYLRMSWISRMLGGAYNQWAGSTTEENLAEQTNRLIDMLETLRKRWGLPFDFKGFDHQPTTDEILLIVDWICAHAMLNVPDARRAEATAQIEIVKRGFRNATLVVKTEEGEVKLGVKGGLMSGLRWTTIIGNAWNSVVTLAVIRSLAALGVNGAVVKRWIRGDDSALVCPNWQAASTVAHAFSWVGAEGGFGKFSIWPESCEFLRQQIGPDRVSAYGVRLVAGYNQRKPWTNEPYKPFATLAAQASVRDSLIRRGYDEAAVWALWDSTVRGYCRKKRLARAWVSLPVGLGGLGLEPWRGALPGTRLPTPVLPKLTWVNSVHRGEVELAAIAASINPSYDRDELKAIAEEEQQTTLLSNARPEVMRLLREPSYSVKWHTVPVEAPRVTWADGPRPQMLQPEPGVVELLSKISAPFWGAGIDAAGPWRNWTRVERATGVRAIRLLRERFPTVAAWLRLLERKGMRRRDALDWLFATTSFPANGINPVVASLSAAIVRSWLGDITKQDWRDRWHRSLYVYSVGASSRLAHSRFYRTLYNW